MVVVPDLKVGIGQRCLPMEECSCIDSV